jgi:pyroglutamyl-peptidase
MAGALRATDAGDAGEFRQYDERVRQTRLDLLITGFGPFARVPRNPSGVLAHLLARSFRRGTSKIHVFETAYARVSQDMPRLAALTPRAVLMLGVAPRARQMQVELRAINRRAVSARDASAALPKTPVIAPGAAAFMQGRHKGMVLVQRLRSAGVAARLSRDAGRYLCNVAYWQMLEALPEARVVFLHIPLPRTGQKRDKRPGMAQMLNALRALLRGGL